MTARVLAAVVAVAAVLWAPDALSEGLWTVDGQGRVLKAKKSRASLQRTPPDDDFPVDLGATHGDPDALRYLVTSAQGELPPLVSLASLDARGDVIDRLEGVALTAVSCPGAVDDGRACAVTAPIRAVADAVDRLHPVVRERSLRASLGGAIVVTRDHDVIGRVRVTGPRDSPIGTIGRYRGRLRFVFVRLSPGGALPLGGDAAGAREIAARAQARASSLWQACGITFGPADDLRVEIVDPPPAAMLSVGCGHGLPASGGSLRFRVAGRLVEVDTVAGQSPAETARRVAMALERRGLRATVFDNPPMTAGAGASSDVTVRDAAGRLQSLAPARGGLSDDPTMRACIGHVNLEDGLQHFSDVDASVGTLEERALLRSVDDGDPATIDVVLVPGFGRGGRIGESFIGADGGTIRNVVVVDRAGIRGGTAAFTLAHELGHVLLDDPGHPDDYGTDLPTRLMDADAADATAFGPRRLDVRECARAIRQSGPGGAVRMLEPWPLEREDVAKEPEK